MKRALVLFILLICAACSFEHGAKPPPPSNASQAIAAPSVCRIGPNEGPVIAERGIGGTGMPLFNTPLPASANSPALPFGQNRGIGGTGAPSSGTGTKSLAGNTGIIGEITGFASVCLNGVEVAYDPATAININGAAQSPESLRAGQVAAIVAAPDSQTRGGFLANSVAIRYEVSGPVSAADANELIVAGQTVTRNAKTWGMRHVTPGDWIAVSGFRNHAGKIVATRIDPALPGTVIVHGNIIRKAQNDWIGGLKLRLPPAPPPFHNHEAVAVTGTLDGSVLEVESLTPDLLYSDPQAYFGPSVKRLLIESYVYTIGGPAYVAVGTSIYLAEGKLFYNPSGPSIYSLIVSPNGTLHAVGHLLGTIGTAINPFSSGPATHKNDGQPPP